MEKYLSITHPEYVIIRMSVNYKLILSLGFGMTLLILEMKVKKGKPIANLLLADTNYDI